VHLKEAQVSLISGIGQIGGYWDKFQILAQLMEELGKCQQPSNGKKACALEQLERNLQGEVGDLLFTLVAFSNVMSLDLEQCLTRTMQKYNTRDAKAWINRTHSGDA